MISHALPQNGLSLIRKKGLVQPPPPPPSPPLAGTGQYTAGLLTEMPGSPQSQQFNTLDAALSSNSDIECLNGFTLSAHLVLKTEMGYHISRGSNKGLPWLDTYYAVPEA